jgi:hypothetical protein
MTLYARPALHRLSLLAVLPLSLLAGCGGADTNDKFAPPCPVPSIPRDTSDLRRFRGAGRDITDSVLEGRITGIEGSCTRGDAGFVTATLAVGLELTRGPANQRRTADVAYFVAVSEGDRIIDKKIYTLRAEFPANAERLRLAGDQIELQIPVTATKTAAAYRVSFGFQLTPEELQVNRTRPQR